MQKFLQKNTFRTCLKLLYRNYSINRKLYWLPISENIPRANLNEHEIHISKGNNIKIMNLSSGLGFLVIVLQIEERISIFRCIHNQSENINDIYMKPLLSNYTFTNTPLVSCGRDHSLIYGFLKNFSCFKLLCFGSNSYGQCGICPELNVTEKILPFNYPITQVQCGLDHSIIVTKEGKVFSCGLSTDGQTGLATLENVCSFKELNFGKSQIKIKKVSSCADTNLAVTEDNRVFSWGNNEYGQIFTNNDDIQIASPVELPLEQCGKIRDILALGSMCLVLNEINEVFVWGLTTIQGIKNYCKNPTKILQIGLDGEIVSEKIVQIFGSVHFGMLKTVSGRLFIVGNYPRKKDMCEPGNFMSNEINLPRQVNDLCCGMNRIFFTL